MYYGASLPFVTNLVSLYTSIRNFFDISKYFLRRVLELNQFVCYHGFGLANRPLTVRATLRCVSIHFDNTLAHPAGLEPATHCFVTLRFSPPSKLVCALDFPFTISIDLGGCRQVSTPFLNQHHTYIYMCVYSKLGSGLSYEEIMQKLQQ